MLKTLLVTSMLASAVAASPVWGQMTQIGSVVITPAQSDEYVIEQLVRLYRKTPATYAQSLAFLQAQRPYLVGRFNKLTLRGPTPKVLTSAAVTATAPAATGGTATTRTVRPKPASAGDKPATASVYDGQTAMQNNGVFIALGVLGLAAAAGAGGGGGDSVTASQWHDAYRAPRHRTEQTAARLLRDTVSDASASITVSSRGRTS
jgi:hypothetical protein